VRSASVVAASPFATVGATSAGTTNLTVNRTWKSRFHNRVKDAFGKAAAQSSDISRGEIQVGFRTQEQQEAAIEAAHVELERRKMIAAVYQHHPTLIPCDANSRLIIELMERFAGHEVMPSYALFQSALDENPDELKNFVQRPIDRQKAQLVEDILSLLASKNGGRDGKYSHFNLQTEKKRMSVWSLDALRLRLAEIREKQRMSTVPLPVLKAVVAEAHRDQSVGGYPRLPDSMWDGTKHVKVDATYLNGLIQNDFWQFKKLVRLYGSTRVDQRRGIK
jgi:hypothetical protein